MYNLKRIFNITDSSRQLYVHFYFYKKIASFLPMPAISRSELSDIRVSVFGKKRAYSNRGFPHFWLVKFYLLNVDLLIAYAKKTCLRAQLRKFSGIEPWQFVGIVATEKRIARETSLCSTMIRRILPAMLVEWNVVVRPFQFHQTFHHPCQLPCQMSTPFIGRWQNLFIRKFPIALRVHFSWFYKNI